MDTVLSECDLWVLEGYDNERSPIKHLAFDYIKILLVDMRE